MTPESVLKQAVAAQLWLLRSPVPELAELGRMSLELGLVVDPQSPYVACTDGSIIYLGLRYGRLPLPVQRYVIAHEVVHCARGHLWRLPATMLANCAADMEVEWSLRPYETADCRMPTPAEEQAMGTSPIRCPSAWDKTSAEVLLTRLAQHGPGVFGLRLTQDGAGIPGGDSASPQSGSSQSGSSQSGGAGSSQSGSSQSGSSQSGESGSSQSGSSQSGGAGSPQSGESGSSQSGESGPSQSGESQAGSQAGGGGGGAPCSPESFGAFTAPGSLLAKARAAAQDGRCAMDKVAQQRLGSGSETQREIQSRWGQDAEHDSGRADAASGQSDSTGEAGSSTGAETPQEIRSRWERAALRAWAKGAGGFVEDLVAAARPRPEDWVAELAAHLTQRLQEPTWRRGSRRMAGGPVLYPGRQERQRVLVVIRDTSGSISNEELAEITDAVIAIQRQLHATMYLADADTQVHRWIRVPHDAPLPEEWARRGQGRGGTNYRVPVQQMLEIARQEGGILHGIVYIGDMCVDPSDVPTDEDAEGVPLVYVRVGSYEFTPPYGFLVSYPRD